MKNLQYNTHLLLTSKHKILITLVIYFIFYITLKSTHLAYCMTDSGELPVLSEETKLSHQVLALKQEIMTYAGSQIELLERIEKQEQEIAELKNCLRAMEAEKKLPDAYWRYRQDEFFSRDIFKRNQI